MNYELIHDAQRIMKAKDTTFYAILFQKDICNEMGEEEASVIIKAKEDGFNLHYLRSEVGTFDEEEVSRIVDEYEKFMTCDELLDFLSLHQLVYDFDCHYKAIK